MLATPRTLSASCSLDWTAVERRYQSPFSSFHRWPDLYLSSPAHCRIFTLTWRAWPRPSLHQPRSLTLPARGWCLPSPTIPHCWSGSKAFPLLHASGIPTKSNGASSPAPSRRPSSALSLPTKALSPAPPPLSTLTPRYPSAFLLQPVAAIDSSLTDTEVLLKIASGPPPTAVVAPTCLCQSCFLFALNLSPQEVEGSLSDTRKILEIASGPPPSTAAAEAGRKPRKPRKKDARTVDLSEGEYVLAFPYDKALVAELSALPEPFRRWEPASKTWVVRPAPDTTPLVQAFVDRFGFTASPAAAAGLASSPQDGRAADSGVGAAESEGPPALALSAGRNQAKAPKATVQLDQEGSNFVVSFPFDEIDSKSPLRQLRAEILAEIKALPAPSRTKVNSSAWLIRVNEETAPVVRFLLDKGFKATTQVLEVAASVVFPSLFFALPIHLWRSVIAWCGDYNHLRCIPRRLGGEQPKLLPHSQALSLNTSEAPREAVAQRLFDDIFRRADKNDNGKIELHEFIDYFGLDLDRKQVCPPEVLPLVPLGSCILDFSSPLPSFLPSSCLN